MEGEEYKNGEQMREKGREEIACLCVHTHNANIDTHTMHTHTHIHNTHMNTHNAHIQCTYRHTQ